jgi:hypothetical protein
MSKIKQIQTIEQSNSQSYSQSHNLSNSQLARSKQKVTLMSENSVITGSSKRVDQVIIVQKAKNKQYKLWVDEDPVKIGMEFCVEWWGNGLANFCAQPGNSVPITSL